jgi:hypothetical protein
MIAAVLIEGDRTEVRRLLLALFALGLTYLAVTAPNFKGPHGYPFAALFMVGVALACVAVVRRLPPAAAWAFCLSLIVFSGWQWEWTFTRMHGPLDPNFADTSQQMLHQAYASVGDHAEGKQFVVTASGNYLNYEIIAFEYLKKGRKPPPGVGMQLIGNLDQHRRAILGADLVLAFSPDISGIIPNLPTSAPQFRADLIKTIEGSGMFDPPIRIPDTLHGGEALIYRARAPGFSAFFKEENLGGVSGPYPQWNLPQVRWGYGERSVLVAQGAPDGNATLVIQALAQINSQGMTVLVNGSVAVAADLTSTFEGFQVPFSYDGSGRASIEIRYKVPSSNAVLFKGLAVR